MLTIRLRRKGKKNQPFFRVIVVDKRKSSTGGHAVEIVGNIDPLTKKKILHKERILHWISKGAKPSDTVHNLLVSEKIIDAKKIAKKSRKPAEAVASAAATALAAATPATEAPKEEAPVEAKPAEEAKPEAKPVEAPKEEPKPAEEAKPEEKPAA